MVNIIVSFLRVPESGKHYILTQGPMDKEDQRTLSNNMMLMLGRPGAGNIAHTGKSHIPIIGGIFATLSDPTSFGCPIFNLGIVYLQLSSVLNFPVFL